MIEPRPRQVGGLVDRAVATVLARRVVQEVAHSLRNSPAESVEPAAIEQELIDLGLLNAYVRQALEDHAKGC